MMTDVQLAETRTNVAVAIEALRRAIEGPVAVLAREDPELFEAIALARQNAIAAHTLVRDFEKLMETRQEATR